MPYLSLSTRIPLYIACGVLYAILATMCALWLYRYHYVSNLRDPYHLNQRHKCITSRHYHTTWGYLYCCVFSCAIGHPLSILICYVLHSDTRKPTIILAYLLSDVSTFSMSCMCVIRAYLIMFDKRYNLALKEQKWSKKLVHNQLDGGGSDTGTGAAASAVMRDSMFVRFRSTLGNDKYVSLFVLCLIEPLLIVVVITPFLALDARDQSYHDDAYHISTILRDVCAFPLVLCVFGSYRMLPRHNESVGLKVELRAIVYTAVATFIATHVVVSSIRVIDPRVIDPRYLLLINSILQIASSFSLLYISTAYITPKLHAIITEDYSSRSGGANTNTNATGGGGTSNMSLMTRMHMVLTRRRSEIGGGAGLFMGTPSVHPIEVQVSAEKRLRKTITIWRRRQDAPISAYLYSPHTRGGGEVQPPMHSNTNTMSSMPAMNMSSASLQHKAINAHNKSPFAISVKQAPQLQLEDANETEMELEDDGEQKEEEQEEEEEEEEEEDVGIVEVDDGRSRQTTLETHVHSLWYDSQANNTYSMQRKETGPSVGPSQARHQNDSSMTLPMHSQLSQVHRDTMSKTIPVMTMLQGVSNRSASDPEEDSNKKAGHSNHPVSSDLSLLAPATTQGGTILRYMNNMMQTASTGKESNEHEQKSNFEIVEDEHEPTTSIMDDDVLFSEHDSVLQLSSTTMNRGVSPSHNKNMTAQNSNSKPNASQTSDVSTLRLQLVPTQRDRTGSTRSSIHTSTPVSAMTGTPYAADSSRRNTDEGKDKNSNSLRLSNNASKSSQTPRSRRRSSLIALTEGVKSMFGGKSKHDMQDDERVYYAIELSDPLHVVLADEDGLSNFADYACFEYSIENLLFIVEALQYRYLIPKYLFDEDTAKQGGGLDTTQSDEASQATPPEKPQFSKAESCELLMHIINQNKKLPVSSALTRHSDECLEQCEPAAFSLETSSESFQAQHHHHHAQESGHTHTHSSHSNRRKSNHREQPTKCCKACIVEKFSYLITKYIKDHNVNLSSTARWRIMNIWHELQKEPQLRFIQKIATSSPKKLKRFQREKRRQKSMEDDEKGMHNILNRKRSKKSSLSELSKDDDLVYVDDVKEADADADNAADDKEREPSKSLSKSKRAHERILGFMRKKSPIQRQHKTHNSSSQNEHADGVITRTTTSSSTNATGTNEQKDDKVNVIKQRRNRIHRELLARQRTLTNSKQTSRNLVIEDTKEQIPSMSASPQEAKAALMVPDINMELPGVLPPAESTQNTPSHHGLVPASPASPIQLNTAQDRDADHQSQISNSVQSDDSENGKNVSHFTETYNDTDSNQKTTPTTEIDDEPQPSSPQHEAAKEENEIEDDAKTDALQSEAEAVDVVVDAQAAADEKETEVVESEHHEAEEAGPKDTETVAEVKAEPVAADGFGNINFITVLDDAILEIIGLIKTDTWRRFKRSKLFTDWANEYRGS